MPVLYSFRRCPYAIRARLALAAAGFEPGPNLELREVSLRAKPPELLEASAKGTVPVLVVPRKRTGSGKGNGSASEEKQPGLVLEESLEIMQWALEHRDPQGWWIGRSQSEQAEITTLIAENDGRFKHHLDRFKYANRHGAEGEQERPMHRATALAILQRWSERLAATPEGWLLGSRSSLADWALLPFVRQFRLADPAGFDAEPDLKPLQAWLMRFLEGPELATVMAQPWTQPQPWLSRGWIYHLALESDWQPAKRQGFYDRSTRAASLADVGFIHCCTAEQLEGVRQRFYADLADQPGTLRLLVIDPQRLKAEVRWELVPEVGEVFPHVMGVIGMEAVVA
ncbi:DUF952 domain-containing protein [Synechococcus sp. CS-1328]|uniref:DUF952 domain-containing protein n=1 Tax=Synechococcus sp. CS-1328 TaxID=2847976 RepID=UPI00223BF190|nr:DUF952 domain-containing protein [Synechococcus sp. CS-1328]MCT0226008.1 DUF952 domain-containing protein [Synechococcus sp. CS-1328]